ncbi:MAG TPA: ATP-dependent DNA helicase RecG, partial [Caulobacteraceae bacterium]|nr:ATP-dependent DNA helicase RecG [Caulobacteraceae bacterium]
MRPEILFPLFAPATTLKGVGPKVAPLVERVAGPLVRDLLFLLPQDFVERPLTTTAAAQDGKPQTFLVKIDEHLPARTAGRPYRIRALDQTGYIFLIYFKVFGDSLKRQHPQGAARAVSGKVERYDKTGELQMVHPDYLVDAGRLDEIPAFEAIYPATANLASRNIRKLALEALERSPSLPEWQDPAWLARQAWPAWREALQIAHEPHSASDVAPHTPARRRLAFDELLAHQLALAQRKAGRKAQPSEPVASSQLARRLEAALPYRLTAAQIRAQAEIRTDLSAGERMSRLLQGDVGAGKTVVAMLAMADVAAAGKQSALMAPTEILARQHYETIAGPLADQGIGAILLTGRDKGAGRAEKLRALARGHAAVAVGTHALFQDDVVFHDLALAVIDEQHRFGVDQRLLMGGKGEMTDVLVMTATPIPRTLLLTQWGEMEVSRLTGKPAGRMPVRTTLHSMSTLEGVLDAIARKLEEGAQVYWVCPLVAESEALDVAAAEERFAALRMRFGGAVGLAHGQQTPEVRDRALAGFAAGRIRLLVATTVVEVGVDVPQASVMVIEHAERFGLAQLHQLRGRVGRGEAASFCLLLHEDWVNDTARRRLTMLRDTDDGFLIADEDFRLRGGGDVLGTRQAGQPGFRLADPVEHEGLLHMAHRDATLL